MSLTGNYDPNNIFAKILRKEMPCVRVYEDEDVLAFMDVFPQSPGHVLVIPKTPARNLFDIDPEPLANLTKSVQMIAKAVKDALNADGIGVYQYNGAPAGQTVFHIHFHIIPRYQGDVLGVHGQDMPGMADLKDLEVLAKKIRKGL